MTANPTAFKKHFADDSNPPILLSRIAGICQLIASAPEYQHAAICEVSYLVPDLTVFARRIGEGAQ
ncbi:hypothetical protein HNR39_000109 [Glaciimonas immobilis]|uniref:Uncharacterized protein n=1 Tax=Glaciimonas immobilis TaxID=728004 RepID=A0A840RP53_9BURK|nr:hypothetical protein [Glaciimonas immobilis]